MNLNTTLERIEKKLEQMHREADYCQCKEPPVISMIPVEADGTRHEPTPEQIRRETAKHLSRRGDRCPICGKPFRTGTLKETVIVRETVE